MQRIKRKRSLAKTRGLEEPVSWLPFDSRLIPPIFSFAHVQGLPKLFLQIEIILSSIVVMGTLAIAVIKIASSFLE